jgi:zinc D-Ala-D-Ala carboxypeptidase
MPRTGAENAMNWNAGIGMLLVLTAVGASDPAGGAPSAPSRLVVLPRRAVLAPGASLRLAVALDSGRGDCRRLGETDRIHLASSCPLRVDVFKDLVIRVRKSAPTGTCAHIMVCYENHCAEAVVEVRYSLKETARMGKDGVAIVTNPGDPAVLVDKSRALPANYIPPDLVEPSVPFSFKGKAEKRLMRAMAASALEKLFHAAARSGLHLYAVSGYRSYRRQAELFKYYTERDGLNLAERESARPGHSEHQTGLAMDVSCAEVNYLLDERFADTPEGKWLAAHAARFGFIIRYPRKSEASTGYMYEPWHIRYVGVELARTLAEQGLTLEEFFSGETPVTS